MRRLKKPKAPAQYLSVVLVIAVVALKVVEISALVFIVKKNPCNITSENAVQNFQNEDKKLHLNIPQKYLDAYNAIKDLCAATVTGTVCEFCPLNWDAFNGNCYFFSEDRNNWSMGNSDCQRRNAELISIKDVKEKDFILKHVAVKNGHFWIGLTKSGSNWFWKTGEKFQENIRSATSEEHQCATYGKDLSAESCFNPNKWICKKNMSRF
ncbi:killer cell lectin-like receptor subfamily B member 1C isoform X1 [Dendrobates tinctorius]|uniref:killer cell lectin-like receptor subfamily B member 1C isoform X1 n=1 Tax=Dendrobates tinctorius TaxID=92724 RepID=UPI003CC983E0